MRHFLVLATFAAVAVSRAWSAEADQRPPNDWPALPDMSPTCREAEGTFVDPNIWTWESQVPKTGEKIKGKRHAAWAAFAISPAAARTEDANVGTRTFSLSIDNSQTLIITYYLAGSAVASRSFAKNSWSCTPAGMDITTIDRKGAVLDKLPNEGYVSERAIVRVKDAELFVQTVRQTKAKTMGVIHQSFNNVTWQRFRSVK